MHSKFNIRDYETILTIVSQGERKCTTYVLSIQKIDRRCDNRSRVILISFSQENEGNH